MADAAGPPDRSQAASGPREVHLTRRRALDWLLLAGSSTLAAACASDPVAAPGHPQRSPTGYLRPRAHARPGALPPAGSPTSAAPVLTTTAPSATPTASVPTTLPTATTAPPSGPGSSALVDLPDVGRVRDFVPGAPAGAIALTIDDGPTPQWTPLVLDLLARLGITATFCLVGQQAAEQPRLVRRIAAAGHTIVNHSLTHPLRVPALSTAQLVDEVTTPQKILGDILGHPPTLFRSPGGEWTADLLGVLGDAGLKPLGWNVDPRDWSRPGVAVIESAVLAAAAGDIVLCHDGGGDRSETVQALTDVLPRMRARGLRFVPL